MMLRDLMLGKDEFAMRLYCVVRFGVDPKKFGIAFHGWHQSQNFPYQGDEGNIMYIKGRMETAGCFLIGENRDAGEAETARLHVFFVSLEETKEMLDRLPRGEKVENPDVARSKIGKTSRVIRPVDRSAHRVTGISYQESGSSS